jgi:hypothetical protein
MDRVGDPRCLQAIRQGIGIKLQISGECSLRRSVFILRRRKTSGTSGAMRTERIRIGFAVVQLPFHHPVQLVVQLALLDNLSRGRIDVGLGKGTIYNEYEFVGHGLRSDDSRVRMEEAIDIIGACGAVARHLQWQVFPGAGAGNCGPARCSAPTCRFGAA